MAVCLMNTINSSSQSNVTVYELNASEVGQKFQLSFTTLNQALMGVYWFFTYIMLTDKLYPPLCQDHAYLFLLYISWRDMALHRDGSHRREHCQPTDRAAGSGVDHTHIVVFPSTFCARLFHTAKNRSAYVKQIIYQKQSNVVSKQWQKISLFQKLHRSSIIGLWTREVIINSRLAISHSAPWK